MSPCTERKIPEFLTGITIENNNRVGRRHKI